MRARIDVTNPLLSYGSASVAGILQKLPFRVILKIITRYSGAFEQVKFMSLPSRRRNPGNHPPESIKQVIKRARAKQARYLDLSNRELNDVPEQIRDLLKLEHLNLYRNN